MSYQQRQVVPVCDNVTAFVRGITIKKTKGAGKPYLNVSLALNLNGVWYQGYSKLWEEQDTGYSTYQFVTEALLSAGKVLVTCKHNPGQDGKVYDNLYINGPATPQAPQAAQPVAQPQPVQPVQQPAPQTYTDPAPVVQPVPQAPPTPPPAPAPQQYYQAEDPNDIPF